MAQWLEESACPEPKGHDLKDRQATIQKIGSVGESRNTRNHIENQEIPVKISIPSVRTGLLRPFAISPGTTVRSDSYVQSFSGKE